MSERKRPLVLWASPLLLAIASSAFAAAPTKPTAPAAKTSLLNKVVADFELRDCLGAKRALSHYQDSSYIVVAFLGTDCPLVKMYGPRLSALAKQYGPRGVTFLGINSNSQDSVTKANMFARQSGIHFPILLDPMGKVAGLFGATRTPEIFVLNARRVVCYHGRIDDQFGVGTQRKAPLRSDLAIALAELMEGKSASVPETELAGCLIGRAILAKPIGDITYHNQVSRIVGKHCMECHREGEAAPFPLTNYAEVVGWTSMIREVVDNRRMPPWFADPKHGKFKNDARLNDEDRATLLKWVDNGAPEGDPAQATLPPTFATGWRIPEPDLVIHMSDKPARIRKDGAEGYKTFVVDPGFKRDVWVRAAEARPGNRSVVHHHLVYFVAPFGNDTASQMLCQIAGYAPGTPPQVYPEGTAIRIPARSKIHFQMHYTPTGVEQQDRSSVGLVFADPNKVRFEVRNQMALNFKLKIPPGDADYRADAKYRFPRDATLINLAPHMHYRGKSFRFELVGPDGARQTLLDVPRYDFNWQLRYDLAQPIRIPEGSWIHCHAVFDNSADNPSNPDPTKTVHFGEQTWEEMMVGVFQTIEPRQASGVSVSDASTR